MFGEQLEVITKIIFLLPPFSFQIGNMTGFAGAWLPGTRHDTALLTGGLNCCWLTIPAILIVVFLLFLLYRSGNRENAQGGFLFGAGERMQPNVEDGDLFAMITARVREGVVLLGENGRPVFWNPVAESFFAAGDVDWTGAAIWTSLNEIGGEEVLSRDETEKLLSMKASVSETISFEVRRPQLPVGGSVFRGELSQISAHSRVRGILVLRDVTREQEILEKLIGREEQLRTLINASPDIICFKDGDGRWLEANDTDLELFSLGDVNYRGKTDRELAEFTDPIYRESFLACELSDEMTWQSETLSHTVEVIRKPDGTEKHFDVIKVPLFNDDGTRKGLVVLGRDIDDRIRYENELLCQQQLLQRILDSLPDGILVVNADFTVALANRPFREIWGLGELEGDAKCFEWTHCRAASDDKELHPCLMKEIRKKKVPVEYQFVHKGPNGEKRQLQLRAFPIFNDVGEFIQLIETYSDITEKLRLEGEYVQAQKMEVVGRLAGGIAHDFNNLLQVILGAVEVLQFEVSPDSGPAERARDIMEAAKRAAELTRRLLAFSRRQSVSLKVVDLNKVVREMIKLIRRVIGEDIHVSFQPFSGSALSKLDSGQIEQVLMNLCVNARDAMPKGGTLHIEVRGMKLDDAFCQQHSGAVPGEYFVMAVSDSGCGMDKETLSHIFEPFFTTKESGKGTGLGLSSAFGIVKQHGGFIRVSSVLGEGTRFEVYLPKANISEENQALPNEKSNLSACSGKSVLLIEDDPVVLEIEHAMLEHLGLKTTGETNGISALARLEKDPTAFDLVITDFVMPGMNGGELIEKIRDRYPDLPVLCVSGYAGDGSEYLSQMCRMDAILKKPFTEEELSAKIIELLDPDSANLSNDNMPD